MTREDDHDVLLRLEGKVDGIAVTVEEIKRGETANCVRHSAKVSKAFLHIKGLWAVVGPVAFILMAVFVKWLIGG